MLMIRLSRVGKKKYATYRIVIQEKARDPWAKALEILGNYNPHTKELVCKEDRIKHWLAMGAQASDTVHNLFITKGIIEGTKKRNSTLNKKSDVAKRAEAAKSKAESEAKPEEKKEDPEEKTPATEEIKPETPAEEVKEEVKEEPKIEESKAETKEEAKSEEPQSDDGAKEKKEEETKE